MRILMAHNAGFCEGVEKALDIALKQIKKDLPVYMLGNLVHNKQVIEKLKNSGIKTISQLSSVPEHSNGILLISTHGVGPQIYEQAKKLALEIVDTTCAWVKRAQKLARESIEKGESLIILGDKGHPEVRGIVEWSNGLGKVIENADQVKYLDFDADNKIALIAQTTQSEKEFESTVAKLKSNYKNLSVYNTICGATSKRQCAAQAIAKKVDLMLVIGDLLSANTKRLTELCLNLNPNTHQIQTFRDLKADWLKKIKSIGISAGASTPDWVIKDVVRKLKSN